MRRLPSAACAACVPWRGMRRCVAFLPSAAADSHACFLPCFTHLCFTHFSRVYLAYSVVSKLFESAWFGSQAFDGATVFNANIGAWNTATMTTMGYVCALCHRLRVRRACLGLRMRRCVACVPSAAADSHACFLPCFTHSAVLHSFLEYFSHSP
jgi:hypothetical protein